MIPEFNQNMNASDLEWHRMSPNKEILEELIRKGFGSSLVSVSHHVGFVIGDLFVDVASVETLLFNHHFLQRLFGDRYLAVARILAETPEFERLKKIKEELENHD